MLRSLDSPYPTRLCHRSTVPPSRFHDPRTGHHIPAPSSIHHTDRRNSGLFGIQFRSHRRIHRRSPCSQHHTYKLGFSGCCHTLLDCCNPVHLDSLLSDIRIHTIQADTDRSDWLWCKTHDLSRSLDPQDSSSPHRTLPTSPGWCPWSGFYIHNCCWCKLQFLVFRNMMIR